MTHLNSTMPSCYLSFPKLISPITTFFLMNAVNQERLNLTLDKAVKKYLQQQQTVHFYNSKILSLAIVTWTIPFYYYQ